MPKNSAEEPKEPKEPKEIKEAKEPKPKADDLPAFVEQGIRDSIKSIALLSPFCFAGYLLLQNQILMAVLVAVFGFVARVIYVVWKNSTDGFTDEIGITATQWGRGIAKYLAKYLPEWLGDHFDALKWRFSKVDQKYLDCLAEDCLWLPTDGYEKRVKDPTLEEV